jgi:hypothetical protein
MTVAHRTMGATLVGLPGAIPWAETAEPLQYDPRVALRKDAKIELIRSVPLFSRCTKKELAAIASEAYEFNPPEGTMLTKQGRAGPRVHCHRRGVRGGGQERPQGRPPRSR